MKGSDAEFGFHFGTSQSFDFYAAAGPYYFVGEAAPATWGGKARISGTFKDMLTLEISDSYDRTFHNKFQGQIGLTFSFGPQSKDSCKATKVLVNRMLQPVGRQEIIVVDHAKKNTAAINPATGLPYFFVFVDNTSSSNGTYESPYHNFAQAQANSSPNDVIYVFPGDGTTKGMDSGIALQPSQKFWGSGVSHLIQTSAGTISIPAQNTSAPTITNTNINTEGNAITLAANNAISGFTIASARNDAIYGTNPQSLEVSSCTIENTVTYAIEASFPGDASVLLTNNQFLNNSNGILLTLNGTSTVVCSNNTFQGQTSVSSIPLELDAVSSNVLTAQIENNVFHANKSGSILVGLTSVLDATISVLNNTITNNGSGSRGSGLGASFAILPTGTTNNCSIVFNGNTVSGNTLLDTTSNSLSFNPSGAFNTLSVTASSNTISNNGAAAIALATPVVNSLTLLVTGNTITGCGDHGIAASASGSTPTGNITINNNTIADITNNSNGIDIAQDFSTLTLTILNNEINQCEGSGITSYAPDGIDSFILNVSGNTISNCQNLSSNGASGIDIDQYTSLAGSITNNTLSGNTEPAVNVGSLLASPTVCLTLTGNSNSSDYILVNPDGGVFHLSPCDVHSVNTGTITPSDSVTLVKSCPGATPCP